MKKRIFILLIGLAALALVGLARPPAALAETNIFASPVQAACYLARPDTCKIQVEPFSIAIASGQKLVRFQLVAIQSGTGRQTIIHDFRPDVSNPVPGLGTTYSPSRVALDYAATCGLSYAISLQGQDSGDAGLLNLGLTGYFTCPTGTYLQYLPVARK